MSSEEQKRLKVYVVGGGVEYLRLMYRMAYDGAKDIEDADVILFTGGEDVDPQLYGERALAKTHFNPNRDAREIAIYKEALKREIPMVGICRGGQFLNVMNEGKMWQHVNGHTGSHKAYVQIAPFIGKGKTAKPREVTVTSTHHQMMIPAKHGMVLLTANEALEKIAAGREVSGKWPKDPDTEAVFYDGTNCLCFQPHPEFAAATPECVDLFEEFMEAFIVPNTPFSRSKKAKEKK